jgi:inosose dehydratase
VKRRKFIATTATSLAASAIPLSAMNQSGNRKHIATNVYPWFTFYRRRGNDFNENLDAGLGAVAKTGVDGFEPIGNSPGEVAAMGPLLKKHGLAMRSLYVNSTLHDPAEAEESVMQVLGIADASRKLGVRILVTNPSPIRWGGPENKDDNQLREQAQNLDFLGAELKRRGMVLAYHNHDAELRAGGREFHHMLTATDPDHVKFCLDSHWVFRGCGDSQVALFDAVQHYHERIVELHLRQSVGGPWTEVFMTDGDIDYRRLFDQLAAWEIEPHLVLEQAVEDGSPDTMDAVAAHIASRKNLAAALS